MKPRLTSSIVSGIVLAAGLACGSAHAQEGGQETAPQAAETPAEPEAASAPETPPGKQPLFLTCKGGGVWVSHGTETVTFPGSNGRRSTNGYTTTTDRAPYEAEVLIELFTGNDRIRLPRPILPLLGRTADGWYRIRDSNASDRVINAITKINMLNTPRIRIDRVAGTMEISAPSGSFRGDCEKTKPAGEAKPKF